MRPPQTRSDLEPGHDRFAGAVNNPLRKFGAARTADSLHPGYISNRIKTA